MTLLLKLGFFFHRPYSQAGFSFIFVLVWIFSIVLGDPSISINVVDDLENRSMDISRNVAENSASSIISTQVLHQAELAPRPSIDIFKRFFYGDDHISASTRSAEDDVFRNSKEVTSSSSSEFNAAPSAIYPSSASIPSTPPIKIASREQLFEYYRELQAMGSDEECSSNASSGFIKASKYLKKEFVNYQKDSDFLKEFHSKGQSSLPSLQEELRSSTGLDTELVDSVSLLTVVQSLPSNETDDVLPPTTNELFRDILLNKKHNAM